LLDRKCLQKRISVPAFVSLNELEISGFVAIHALADDARTPFRRLTKGGLMKKQALHLVMGLTLVAVPAITRTYGQGPSAGRFKVPFEFHVSGKVMPAGWSLRPGIRSEKDGVEERPSGSPDNRSLPAVEEPGWHRSWRIRLQVE